MSEFRIAPPLKILLQACEESRLEIRFIGEESGHLARVSNGERFFYAGGAITPTYPLNSAVSQDLCQDKSYCSELLRSVDLATPEEELFFPSFPQKNAFKIRNRGIPDAISYVNQRLEYPVIVKPNRGSMGRGVRKVDNDTDLVLAMQGTVTYGHACLVQNVVDGDEYRLFCIDGKPQFVYRKVRPSIEGDGASSIIALIASVEKLNHSKMDLDDIETSLRGMETDQFVSFDEKNVMRSVPKAGVRLSMGAASNIYLGARIDGLSTSFQAFHSELAERVASILQVRVYGIDFFLPAGSSCIEDAVVLEVNGNPSLCGIWDAGERELCLAIWGKIFELYFGAQVAEAL